MRSGVEPRDATPKEFNVKRAAFKIEPIKVRDLEFAASGRFEAARQSHNFLVIEIQAWHGIVRFWLFGFFLKGEYPTIRGKLDDPVGAGIGDVVAENCRAFAAGGGVG